MQVLRPVSKELVVDFHLSHKSFIGRIFVPGLHVEEDIHVSRALLLQEFLDVGVCLDCYPHGIFCVPFNDIETQAVDPEVHVEERDFLQNVLRAFCK